MDTRSLPTERLLELTKTETNQELQKAIIRELATRGRATIITDGDDLHSIRQKVMAVTPKDSIPPAWLD